MTNMRSRAQVHWRVQGPHDGFVMKVRPNKRLKLTAPRSWEELRLCAAEPCASLNQFGAGVRRRRSLSAIR